MIILAKNARKGVDSLDDHFCLITPGTIHSSSDRGIEAIALLIESREIKADTRYEASSNTSTTYLGGR